MTPSNSGGGSCKGVFEAAWRSGDGNIGQCPVARCGGECVRADEGRAPDVWHGQKQKGQACKIWEKDTNRKALVLEGSKSEPSVRG